MQGEKVTWATTVYRSELPRMKQGEMAGLRVDCGEEEAISDDQRYRKGTL